MVIEALKALASLQSKGEKGIPAGNVPSIRYHPIFRFSRTEDNVYFISWILQCLKRSLVLMSDEEQVLAQDIISEGESSLIYYRSRYGCAAYNFYRADRWFPNGHFLHRFKTFQPTDDADDTAIAYRGLKDANDFIPEIRSHLEEQANGKHGKFLKRGPKLFRQQSLYNTWIGSRGLFVDLDLVVVCNILMFNATYGIEKSELDHSNIAFVIDAVEHGLHVNEKWSLCAWYPFDEVILYGLADLMSTNYYPELEAIRAQVIHELTSLLKKKEHSAVSSLLIQNALMKCNKAYTSHSWKGSVEGYLKKSESFSFGVIPLLHPFDGRWAQGMSAYSLFRMHYRCDAHALSILIEHELLLRSK